MLWPNRVLFILGLTSLISCRHQAAWVPTQTNILSTDASTSQKNMAFKVDLMLARAADLYKNTGLALLQVPGCSSGIFIRGYGEDIPLVADHCIQNLIDSNVEDLEGRLSGYFIDGWREGYLFPTSTVAVRIPLKSFKRNKDLDLAYARGLFPHGLPPGRKALRLALASPKVGEVVLAMHKHTFIWHEEKRGVQYQMTAEALIPVFGFVLANLEKSNLFLLPTSRGESSTPFINVDGELVGILYILYKDKRINIKSEATSVEQIWRHLDATWDK